MSHPTPPQAQAAVDQLRKALTSAEGRDLDPLAAPWEDIEKGVAKLLGGAFSAQNPRHGSVALMLASAFAGRVTRDLGAFWFPNRATTEGAALGFPDAIIVVSPLDIAMQALSRSRLALFDDVNKDLKGVLEKARTQGGRPPGAPALGPADYQRLFDPGFVQFICLDVAQAKAAWENPPDETARALEDAFGRMRAEVPQEVREPLRRELVGALGQMEPGKPAGQQMGRAAQLIELLALVHGSKEATGFAPAELWQDVLLPLLHIGAAETFPPLDEDELAPYVKGADPLLIYVDAVPYKTPAVDEDGLLGLFPPDEILLIDRAFAGVPALRLVQAPLDPLDAIAATFSPEAMRTAVERFTAHVAAEAKKSGIEGQPPERAPGEPSLLDVAVTMLRDLKEVVAAVREGKGILCLRRATEAEASSESGIEELRRALTGPRIILA